MEKTVTADPARGKADTALFGLALVYFVLEWIPGVVGPYGYFIDEFYYLACSEHLALGYVDHPPLSILVLKLVRSILGDSLWALRLLPALAGAATVVLTGRVARRLGADTYGQILAAGAVMVGSVYQVMFSFYSMNAFSTLFWLLSFWVLVEIELRDAPRLWLAFGLLSGLALMNKHTFGLLLLGLAIGVLVTRARRHLRSRWLWLGAGIAVILFLPNLIWQMINDWPSLEFYRNADVYKNVPTPPLEVVRQQVLFMNPAALPIWVAGLVFLLVSAGGRSLRHLGWLYVVLLLLMLAGQKSRPDRIADAYTILFAAGGVVLGGLVQRRSLRWLGWFLPAVLVFFGLAFAPLGLPLLPPSLTSRYASALGIVPQIEKGEGKRSELPQWLADRHGWQELVVDVEAAANEIEPQERAIVLAPSYGQAGAIEWLGRGKDLPPVYGLQNSYSDWGPPADPVDVAIIVGPFSEEGVRWLFEDVTRFRVHDCIWCTPWRDEVPIWLARKQKVLFRDAWPRLKHYE